MHSFQVSSLRELRNLGLCRTQFRQLVPGHWIGIKGRTFTPLHFITDPNRLAGVQMQGPEG